jgi:hypothetical protein
MARPSTQPPGSRANAAVQVPYEALWHSDAKGFRAGRRELVLAHTVGGAEGALWYRLPAAKSYFGP